MSNSTKKKKYRTARLRCRACREVIEPGEPRAVFVSRVGDDWWYHDRCRG